MSEADGIEPRRRQVWDVQIKRRVTEYRVYAAVYEACGEVTWASFPRQAETLLGIHLLVGYTSLRTEARQSLRGVQEPFAALLGLPASLGVPEEAGGLVSWGVGAGHGL